MNRYSSNPVILQQKIIHLQAELSKFKSIQKDKLLLENQQLHEQVHQLRSENELLKKQFITSNLKETAQTTHPVSSYKKTPISVNNGDTEGISNGWFLSNLTHERNKN